MIIDTHTHCYFDGLENNIEEIIAHMEAAGVEKAVQIGCDIVSSEQAIALAQKFPSHFFATVGYHPEEIQDIPFSSDHLILARIEQIIQQHPKEVVALGECGLDFHYLDGVQPQQAQNTCLNEDCLSQKAKGQIENQKLWWQAQWEIAKKYHLPLVIHTRDALKETLEGIQDFQITRAIMHCYSGDIPFARTLLDFSDELYFSFSGTLTFPKSQILRDVVQMLPLDKILIETDAPFLAPQPVRGKQNEPAYVRHTLDTLIELRSESAQEIEQQLYKNSKKIYAIR